uniref:Titin-like n=1 Tax=Loa loa TaxID=7209 RepID=A0A1I7VJN4_LOALO
MDRLNRTEDWKKLEQTVEILHRIKSAIISKELTTELVHVTDMKAPAESEDLEETEANQLVHVTDMKAPAEFEEIMDRLNRTEELEETETKPFEDFTPDKESAIISKELTTELVHVTDMKALAESEEIMDRLNRTEELEETETKPFEDFTPDKESAIISKELTTELPHVTDMIAPTESEDLEETETKPFEDFTPDKESAIISKELTTELPHVTDMIAPTESEEIMDRLNRTEELEETETKPFEDFTPDKESAIISKELTTELVHVTDMKAPAESEEIMDRLNRTEELEETETKPFEDFTPDKESAIISKELTTELPHVTDMIAPTESEDLEETETKPFEDFTPDKESAIISKELTTELPHVTDMIAPTESEDLKETETKPFEDFTPDKESAIISKELTTELVHVTDMKPPAESEEIMDRLNRTEDLEETGTKPFEDFTPDKESAIISKELTTELVHVTDMKPPAESEEIMDRLNRTEDLEETETKSFQDFMLDREEYGAVMSKELTTEGEDTETKALTESELEDRSSWTEALVETEIKPFEDFIPSREAVSEYGILVSEFALTEEKPISSRNLMYEVPIQTDELMKQCGDMHVTNSESKHFQTRLMRFSRDAATAAEGTGTAPIVLARLRVSKVCDSVSGGGEISHGRSIQMVSERASSETIRDELEWMQSQANGLNEGKTSVQCEDSVGGNAHLELLTKDVLTKEHQIPLAAEVSTTERLIQEYAEYDMVPTTEEETRSPAVYKTLFEHEILQPRAEVQHQFLTKKVPEKIETKPFKNVMPEYHLQNYDVAVAKEKITRESEEFFKKNRYPGNAASVEMFRKDLERTEAQKFKDILQQECRASLLKKLVTEEELMVLHEKEQKTFFGQKCSVTQAEEKKHIPLEGKQSIITPLSLYGTRESEESVCMLQKEIMNQQSEMGHSEGSEVKLFEGRVSKNAESEGVVFETAIPEEFVEEVGIAKKQATMESDKQDGVGFAEEVIKEQVVEDSLTDIFSSWKYKQIEFSREASSDMDGVKESARDDEAFLRSPEIQSEVEDRQRTTEFAAAKGKEKCTDTKTLPRDVLISSEISFADVVVGHPAHGVNDMTGTEAEQLRTKDRDLQKMGKLISSLTTERLPTELSEEEIMPQQMRESLSKIQEGMEKLPEYQLKQNIVCKGVTLVGGTEKMEGWSPSRFYSVTPFEQSRSLSPKEKEFAKKQEMEVFCEPSLFLNQIQECKNIITDVGYNKTNRDVHLEARKELDTDQRWIDEKKHLRFPEGSETVAREILASGTFTIRDTAKAGDHDVKNDIGETSIEQFPDTDYQFTPPKATKQCDEAAIMREMVAEERILGKETDYNPMENLNKPVQKDEEEDIDSKGTIEPYAVETYLDQKGLVKLDGPESETSTTKQAKTQDKLSYPAMDLPSAVDQTANFISPGVQMDISLLENLYRVSENSCRDQVLIESLREGMQVKTSFKEDIQEEVPENNEVQPMVPSDEVEGRVTVKTGLTDSKKINFDGLTSEGETSYEVDLDGIGHLIMIDEKIKPFCAEAEHPYELTVDISWTPEDEGIDAETGLEKQKFSYAEQVITYPSDDMINAAMKEERVTGSITKENEELSNKINRDGDKSFPMFETIQWQKLTDGSEVTSGKLKTNELIEESAVKTEKVAFEHDKEHEKQFIIEVLGEDKGDSESFLTHRFQPKKYVIKSSEITVVGSTTLQKWLRDGKENQEEFIIQGQQISELTRDEKFEGNVDAKAFEMMDRDQKEFAKKLVTVESEQELTEGLQMVQNLEELKIDSGDDITVPQQSFDAESDEKKLFSIKEPPEQLTAKHDLMTSFEEGKLEDVRIASEGFLDTVEIRPTIPQQSEDNHVLEKGSDRQQSAEFSLSGENEVRKEEESLCYSEEQDMFSMIQEVTSTGKESFKEDLSDPAKTTESAAAVVLAASEALAIFGSIETVQVVEDQKSFLRSASSDAFDSSMEKRKDGEKMSHCEESEKRINSSIISSTEAFVELNDAKVIYGEISDAPWQQAKGRQSEETVSGKQLELAAKECTDEVANEQKVTLLSVLDRYPSEQQECHKFTLSRKKETEEDASPPSFSSMFPTNAGNTQTESMQEVQKRIESLEVIAVVPQQRIEETVINKFSLPAKGQYRETKEDVCELGSVRDDDKRGKVKAIAEPTSEPVSEESLTLTEAPLSKQKTGNGSSEMDEKAKIARGIDLQANAKHLISESMGKLDQTASRSSSNYNIDPSIRKHSFSESRPSEEKVTAGMSVSQVQYEHKADYGSDLKEKLETLIEETNKLKRHAEGCNLLKDDEKNEEELDIQATVMADDNVKPAESLSRSESTYKTATATSRDGYETCLTSQEDTFETAPSCHSQESEYTTATSEASSRLSVMSEERQESATPLAFSHQYSLIVFLLHLRMRNKNQTGKKI